MAKAPQRSFATQDLLRQWVRVAFAKNADIVITNTDSSANFWKSGYPAYARKGARIVERLRSGRFYRHHRACAGEVAGEIRVKPRRHAGAGSYALRVR
jgi:hypothetical protein